MAAIDSIAEVMGRESWRQDLVRNYHDMVERHGLRLDRRYSHEDMESHCFQGLYLAALTWDPRKGLFFSWLCLQIRGQTSRVLRRRRRWARGLSRSGPPSSTKPRSRTPPLTMGHLSSAAVNRRYYYRDRPAS